MGRAFTEPLVFGGHALHPAWDPPGFPTEDGLLSLLCAAHAGGIRTFDATYQAEVEVLGHLLRRWGPPPDVRVGCLQAYMVTRTPDAQRSQLLRWLDLLGRPALDHLYVFPPPDPAQADELRRQKAEGLFRSLGLWLRSPEEPFDPALFDFAAGVYNPAQPELAGRFRELHALGKDVLILAPMGSGGLLRALPPSERGAAAGALLGHALSRPWRSAVSVTMRTRAEVGANVQAAREAFEGPVEPAVPSLFSPAGFRIWDSSRSALAPWDGKFGDAPA